jgi:predicted PurR-regulated permease PerM
MPIARQWAVITLVAGSIVVAALAFWQLRTLLILLLVAFTLAAGMRAGVEALKRRGIPVWLGILLHYALLVGLVALLIVFVVPPALGELRTALGGLPPSPSYVHEKVRHANGVRREVLVALEHLLRQAPTRDELLHPAIVAGRRIGAILAGIVFTLAVAGRPVRAAARPILRRDRNRSHRRAAAGGRRRDRPGPHGLLAAGARDGAVFVGFRLIQDYLINPRVIGRAVGLPPLVVLVSASVVGVVLGPAAVALATPLAAISVTVVEVVLGLRRPSPPVVRAGGVSYDNAPTVREHS